MAPEALDCAKAAVPTKQLPRARASTLRRSGPPNDLLLELLLLDIGCDLPMTPLAGRTRPTHAGGKTGLRGVAPMQPDASGTITAF
ncbi:hypothetical protein GCM10009429_30770 [Dyella marensis]